MVSSDIQSTGFDICQPDVPWKWALYRVFFSVKTSLVRGRIGLVPKLSDEGTLPWPLSGFEPELPKTRLLLVHHSALVKRYYLQPRCEEGGYLQWD